jgi:lipid A disaccharide synthetase
VNIKLTAEEWPLIAAAHTQARLFLANQTREFDHVLAACRIIGLTPGARLSEMRRVANLLSELMQELDKELS